MHETRRSFVSIAALFLLVAADARTQVVPEGALDPTFGDLGVARIGFPEFPTTDQYFVDMVVEPSGKTTLVAEVDEYVGVARLLRNGALDPDFSGGGRFLLYGSLGDNDVKAIARQADGKLVIAGVGHLIAGGPDFFVVRLLPNGEFDSSFHDDGVVLAADFALPPAGDTTDYQTVVDVAVAPDGRIGVVLGSAQEWAVWMSGPTGTPVAAFDGDGWSGPRRFATHEDALDSSYARVCRFDASGGLLVGGGFAAADPEPFVDPYAAAVTRLLPGGAADTSFGGIGTGTALHDWSSLLGGPTRIDHVADLTLYSDGRMLAAGGFCADDGGVDCFGAAFQLDGSGQLVASYGIGGKSAFLFSTNSAVSAAAARAGELIYVVGSDVAAGFTNFGAVRLRSNGFYDLPFGGDGSVTYDISGGASDEVRAAGLHPDGGLLIGGTTRDAGEPAVATVLRVFAGLPFFGTFESGDLAFWDDAVP